MIVAYVKISFEQNTQDMFELAMAEQKLSELSKQIENMMNKQLKHGVIRSTFGTETADYIDYKFNTLKLMILIFWTRLKI